MERRTIPFHELLKEPGYVYQVPATNLAATVRISAEDDILVLSCREVHKKPRTTVVHLMIGQAIKCWDEKHDEKVRELEILRIKLLAAEHIIELYRQKFGSLPPLKRYRALDKRK